MKTCYDRCTLTINRIFKQLQSYDGLYISKNIHYHWIKSYFFIWTNLLFAGLFLLLFLLLIISERDSGMNSCRWTKQRFMGIHLSSSLPIRCGIVRRVFNFRRVEKRGLLSVDYTRIGSNFNHHFLLVSNRYSFFMHVFGYCFWETTTTEKNKDKWEMFSQIFIVPHSDLQFMHMRWMKTFFN